MWDIFISHSSEDKEAFVRPLAKRLKERGLTVWFDEFTLTVGDSLRRSIHRGLAESRYGVVVISESFLNKEWPQKELDGLVARESNGAKIILPIWHGIKADKVRDYSPILADKLAVSSDMGITYVAERLIEAIDQGKNTKAFGRLTYISNNEYNPLPFGDFDLAKQMSHSAALAAAKQMMSDPQSEIPLHDFVLSHVQQSLDQMTRNGIINGDGPSSKVEFQRRLEAFEQAICTSIALFAAASYWNSSNRGFPLAFQKYLTLSKTIGPGFAYCYELMRYPAIASYYSAGIVGFSEGHLSLFAKMTASVQVAAWASASPLSNILWALSPFESISNGPGQTMLDWLNVSDHPAGSMRIFSFLTPLLVEYTSNKQDFVLAFDKFEYLLSLLHADFRISYEKKTGQRVLLWMPTGPYVRRNEWPMPRGWQVMGRSPDDDGGVVASINQEIKEQGERWPPVTAGLFGGSVARALAAMEFARRFFTENGMII